MGEEMRLASYNAENLFQRTRAMNREKGAGDKKGLEMHSELNLILGKSSYSGADKKKIAELMKKLGIAKSDDGGDPERVLTRDEILDDITLYWLTNTGTSSSRSYWDAAQGEGGPFNAIEIAQVPVAVTVFPGEIYRAPRSWGAQSFKKLIYWNEVDKGGRFAAWEQPELFAREIRAAFRPLRSLLSNQADTPKEVGR